MEKIRTNTKFHKIIEILSLVIIVTTIAVLLVTWKTIPDQVPMHYDGAGIPNRYGSKFELWMLVFVQSILYVLLSTVQKVPTMWNVPVNITETNRDAVYRNIKNMILVEKVVVLSIFSYIIYSSAHKQSLFSWFLPITLFLVFGSMLFFFIRVLRVPHQS